MYNMKSWTFILLFGASSFSMPAAAQDIKLSKKTTAAMGSVDTNTIKKHITYLADDKLRGRMPGEPGYQMAVDYVVNEFTQIGLIPAGDAGSFQQKLILRKATLDAKKSSVVIMDNAGNMDSMTIGQQILIMPHATSNKMMVKAPIVFAGYGIEVPGVYTDYMGLDVKGKIVVVLAGTPDGLNLPSTIQSHFSNVASKMEIAAKHGAIGLLFAPVSAVPPLRGAASTTLSVAMNPEKTTAYGRGVAGNMQLSARISYPMLQRLFMNSGKNLTQTLAGLKNRMPASFVTMLSADIKYESSFTDIESYNLVGKVEGSDPVLKNEYVIHTAHLDHVGVGNPVNGDSIYNGAHDNASGVASLLEIGRIYKTMGSKPRRSILIVMVTAEEMGLLGSAYFAGNPTVPKSSIVADVNTDMPTLIAPLLSIAPLGAEHSSIQNNVAFAGKQLDIEVQKDPMPTENRFIRSDQYSFVLQGIPALHVKYGTKTVDPNFDLVKFTNAWRDKNYHKPSDEITNGFDFAAGKKYVQLNFLISYSIAQTTDRPTWNKGDFFAQ
jgi:hypothetical protein